MTAVLEVRDLSVRFATPDGEVSAVNGVSFDVNEGECVGIVGESGSGKSQLFMSVMGLLARNGRTLGSAKYRGTELVGMPVKELNKIRGDKIAMIFQDSMTGLTPHLRIGRQMTEVLVQHKGMSEAQAVKRALDMLNLVRIPEAARRLAQYPHELSGGMRQRIMIAMALLCEPELLIADEPTTALDVTVQAQILDLMADLKRVTKAAIVLITHDLGTVAGLCDKVQVMYGGRFMETGTVRDIFYEPAHPYAAGLLSSMPRLTEERSEKLYAIPGQPPNLQRLPKACPFQERCDFVHDRCATELPLLREVGPGHTKACHLVSLQNPVTDPAAPSLVVA
ncbi:ABC transporter ATP-binding protein [Niveispirillum lacus]|uniref:ABC transporter ATP-binding protein n=1 Tax=Niveispirillum lacus TaxID=1981099 RepID=A0A255Z4S3_9PROT|nr:oligopeptide/dipeptide ABC transporter ATP-binding protein [Niveispirillum lacus]OYQ36523.1 ABC transporter ATP-binding protein [Niveispirillum lacus]